MILWIWKHRRRWKDMKELWEGRYEILDIMVTLHCEDLFGSWKDETKAELAQKGNKCYEWLQYCGTSKVKPLRPWPSRPNMPRPKAEEAK